MLATMMRMSSGGFGPFGVNPKDLTGADFFDGTPRRGMLVFKTAKTYDSFTPVMAGDVEVLVVAGGGKGGRQYCGGGGAGGVVYNATYTIPTSSIQVITGGSVENSVFDNLTALAGGSSLDFQGEDGGSGAGGYMDGSGGSGLQPTSESEGYGNDGGNGFDHSDSDQRAAGGGGGALQQGENAGQERGGDGGDGKEYFGFYYAGGGGGARRHNATAGSDGIGGLGGGGDADHDGTPEEGTPNTGGGGGGGGESGDDTNGGSGIVIVRWGGYDKNYDPTDDSVS